MNLFLMPPLVSVFYNDNQVLFVIEDTFLEPHYDKLTIRYCSKKVSLELFHNNKIIAIIGNIKMAIPIIESKDFFIGWITKNGIMSKSIALDKTDLLRL